MKRLTGLISLRRALVALVLLPAMFLGLRLGLSGGPDATVARPVLVDTSGAGALETGVSEGKIAQDFTISTTDGRRVRLSDFRGRPVVVNFHALWCTSCLTELPEIKAVQEERGRDAFAVLAVNSGESKERALEFVEYLDAPFTFGLDTDLTVTDAYGVHGLPATVFIDANGVIRAAYAGYTGKELLNTFLDAAIAGGPPSDVPVLLRTVSTIPRDRVLNVAQEGNRLMFSSRSLRCDASYCATPLADALAGIPGIEMIEPKFERDSSLIVEFDINVITSAQVIDTVAHLLQTLEDPVYRGELEIVIQVD